jgi:deoxyribonuclease V
MATWPATAHKLTRLQHALGELTPARWQPPTTLPRIGACFVCFEQAQGPGGGGDRGFAGAAVTHHRRLLAGVTSSGPAGGPYLPTLLALRDGPLLERAVRACRSSPRCWWSTPADGTIPGAPALPCISGLSLGCRRSG